MKCSHYVTGRGLKGYGYEAITYRFDTQERWHKQDRSAATPDGKPIIEMMCTSFGHPGIIASTMVEDAQRGWHYSQTLLPVWDESSPEAHGEWQEYLKAPGRMLYFTPMKPDEFLKLSEDNVRSLEEYQIPLPLPEDDRQLAPEMPADMLAALVCDLWYCCYQRIDNPQPENALNEWKTIRLELTDESTERMTLETGIAFVNHVLMPALPPAMRQIVSVSIGGSWDRSVDPNQHPAALQIVLPGASTASAPEEGCYYCDGSTNYYRPLLSKGFSTAMGEAFAADTPENPSPALCDYHAVADRHPFEEISASFELAQYLCYARLHLMRNEKTPGADDAYEAYEYMKAAEKLIAFYLPDEPESELALYTAQLQHDVFRALAQHTPAAVSAKQYRFYAQRVFTFSQAVRPTSIQEKELEDRVLAAGSDLLLKPETLDSESKIPFLQYLDDEHKKKREALLERDGRLFVKLLFDSLIAHGNKIPVAESHLYMLKEYSTRDERAAAKLTKYLCMLQKKDHPLSAVLALNHGLDDESMLEEVGAHFSRHIPAMLEDEAEQIPYFNYAKAVTAASVEKLEALEAQALADYVQNATEDAFLPLEPIIRLFGKLHKDESDEAVEALIRLLEIRSASKQKSISEAEMDVIVKTYHYASGKEEGDAYERLLSCLKEQFSHAIPQALLGDSPTAVEDSFAPWQRYMSFNPQTLPQIKRQFGGALHTYVEENARSVSKRLKEIMSAYRFIAGESSEEAVHSARVVLEARKEADFTTEEIQLLKPVFEFVNDNKTTEASQQFTASLMKQFKAALPAMFDPSGAGGSLADNARQWNDCVVCMGEDGEDFRSLMADECLAYVKANAPRQSKNLKSTLAVFDRLSLSATVAQIEAATAVLAERISRSTLYSQADVNELGNVFAHCEQQPEQPETTAFVDVLLEHFAVGLPHMIADETSGLAAEVSVEPWTETGTKIGAASRRMTEGIGRQLQDYTADQAEALAHRMPQLIKLYASVGLARTEAAQNAVTAILEKRPIDEQNQLSMAEVMCIVDGAGRNARIDNAIVDRYAHVLPALLDAAQTPAQAEAATDIWRTYMEKSPSVEGAMRARFRQAVQQDAGQYDQRLHYLVNFAQAMHWEDSEELRSCLVDVLSKRSESQHFCILNDRECDMLHNLLCAKGSNKELIRGLQTITGRLPTLPEDPEREKMLHQEAVRCLRALLPDMLEAMPSREMSAWHGAAMSIIVSDVQRMFGLCRDFASLYACGAVWNRCSTFSWLRLGDRDTLDRFEVPLNKQDQDELASRIADDLKNVLQRFSLNELLQQVAEEGSGWYTRLLNECIAGLLKDDSDNLLGDIHTYQDALGMKKLLQKHMSNNKSSAPVADALAFVMNHGDDRSIAEEVEQFCQLAEPDKAVAIMKRAVQNSEQWDYLWDMSRWPERLLYAACCHVLSDKPDWDGFLDEVLPTVDLQRIKRLSLTTGSSLPQIVDFIQNWFRNVGKEELAENFVSALRKKRRTFYNLAEGAKAKAKAYLPFSAKNAKADGK